MQTFSRREGGQEGGWKGEREGGTEGDLLHALADPFAISTAGCGSTF